MPVWNWTVSFPEPSRMSPTIEGTIGTAVVEAGLAVWIRLTPVALALTSMATVLPWVTSPLAAGTMLVRMNRSLVMVVRLPDLSTIA